MTTDVTELRRLLWDACYNVRDLGGFRTEAGGETRWRRLVRADNLHRLTDAGRAALADYGVRTIIDLRLSSEIASYASPFAAAIDDGIAYLHRPFVPDEAEGTDPPNRTLAEIYIHMLRRFRPQVAAIMRAIAEAPPGGVLFHCHAGKDRTGVIAALLLKLVGVPHDTIATDYALSYENLREIDQGEIAEWPSGPEGDEYLRRRVAWARDAMLTVLDQVDREYGGVAPYLRGCSLSADHITALRDRLQSDHME